MTLLITYIQVLLNYEKGIKQYDKLLHVNEVLL